MNLENPLDSPKDPLKNRKPAEPEIRFKPITEGLGFHPFSNGLPYAAQNGSVQTIAPKKAAYPEIRPDPRTESRTESRPMGTGAVAAGRPIFVAPGTPSSLGPAHRTRPTSTQPLVDLTKPSYAGSGAKLSAYGPGAFNPTSPSTFASATSSAPRNEDWKNPIENADFTVGYLFQRTFGYVIDTVFNLTVAATILSFALIQTDVELLQTVSTSSLALSVVFLYLCNWAAIAGQEVAFGTSLGKRVFGLSLSGNGSDAFLRALVFIPSQLLGGLGLFAALLDPRKRGWHDRFARAQPISTSHA